MKLSSSSDFVGFKNILNKKSSNISKFEDDFNDLQANESMFFLGKVTNYKISISSILNNYIKTISY